VARAVVATARPGVDRAPPPRPRRSRATSARRSRSVERVNAPQRPRAHSSRRTTARAQVGGENGSTSFLRDDRVEHEARDVRGMGAGVRTATYVP